MRCVAAARKAWLDWVEQAVEACACTPACTVSASSRRRCSELRRSKPWCAGGRRTGEGIEGGAGGSLEGGAVAEAGDRHVPHAVDQDEGHPLRGRHGSFPPRPWRAGRRQWRPTAPAAAGAQQCPGARVEPVPASSALDQ